MFSHTCVRSVCFATVWVCEVKFAPISFLSFSEFLVSSSYVLTCVWLHTKKEARARMQPSVCPVSKSRNKTLDLLHTYCMISWPFSPRSLPHLFFVLGRIMLSQETSHSHSRFVASSKKSSAYSSWTRSSSSLFCWLEAFSSEAIMSTDTNSVYSPPAPISTRYVCVCLLYL